MKLLSEKRNQSEPRPIRLVFYEPYPMGLGGNFVTQRQILERLDRRHFYPIVVAPIPGIALDEFRAMGVECMVLSPPDRIAQYGGKLLRTSYLAKIKVALDLLKYNLAIAKFIKAKRIDLIYCNNIRAQLAVGFAAQITRVPCLLYVKGDLSNPIFDRICFFLASKILFYSAVNRDDRYPWLVKLFAGKIDIVKTGLDPASLSRSGEADFARIRNELDLSPSRLNVAVTGQLYRPKGQHLAIEAVARLAQEFPDLRLYLIGDHVLEAYREYKDELKELAGRLEATERVYFAGWRTDALAIVALMDIMLHPSLSEGFPRAVLEAMALGKPVVASAVGALREAIRDGRNGYLVDPGDVDGIVAKCRILLRNAELRRSMGEEARKTVFSEYLIDDKVARLSEIWRSMCN